VRAWHRTYGLPVLITNCSNNYGPYQFPEKLIPLMILNAVSGKPLPVYGDNIGGHNEKTNLEVVHGVCDILEELHPEKPAKVEHYRDLITYVADRPGHDRRYAIDAGKIQRELGWTPDETFETGLRKTVEWYLNHDEWIRNVLDGSYSGERLGLAGDTGT